MNPIFIFYLFVATFFVWLLLSGSFSRIGDMIKTIIEWFKEEEKDE